MTTDLSPGRAVVLVVDDDSVTRGLLSHGLRRQGYDVATAEDGWAALTAIAEHRPDVVISDVHMPGLSGFELIVRLRSDPQTASIPVIFLSGTTETSHEVAYGLSLGADDYLLKPVVMVELAARIERRLAAPGIPLAGMLTRPPGGLLPQSMFLAEGTRELARADRSGRPGVIAVVEIAERDRIVSQFGTRFFDDIVDEVSALAASSATNLGHVGRDAVGRLLVLVPEVDVDAATARAAGLATVIAQRMFASRGESIHITPAIGIAPFDSGGVSATELVRRARLAAAVAADTLDLRPVLWDPELHESTDAPGRRLPDSWRTWVQFLVTLVVGIGVPFAVYAAADAMGFDLARVAYLVVAVAIVATGVQIWAEGFYALRPIPMPESPSRTFPPASAIIAAYLPNEAATIVETLESFLRIDYPADLQVVLAYNTPRPLPIENSLKALAAQHPRIELLRVEGSTSKAQNVNAALGVVRGEFVGVFDADHQPARDSFRRAWHWLCDDYDVVQGHCVVRNGNASWIARSVAVEFESIYAVSHPGRARLHGFGIFGGSNGYWRTDLLRATRMRGSMLTEDIDSSLRVVEQGGRIASDPHLYSLELAPATLSALWNQRMRWAQGWFQVSLRHLMPAMRSGELTLRQRLGFLTLLGWREVYPWLSIQMIPIIAFLSLKAGGIGNLDWFIPVFVLTALFTLSVGPGQTLFAWILGAPHITKHRSWFWSYLVVASLLYTEFKNVINRISQVKEVARERQWRVTPRGEPEPPSPHDATGMTTGAHPGG